MIGLTATTLPRVLTQSFANSRHGKYRADAGDGIARSDEHCVGGNNGFDHSRSRLGVGGSGETHGVHGILIPALHEIFFEAQLAGRRIHAGLDARIAHGKDARFHSQLFADGRGGFGKRFPFRQQTRAQQMHCKIAVAGVEPRGFAELSHGLQAEKSIAFDAPAALAAEQTGENVSDGVYVWRDVEAPPQQVIAGVDDQSDFFSRDDLPQAIDKLCSAGAAGEHADHAAVSFLWQGLHGRRRLEFFREQSRSRTARAGRNSG